MIKSVECESSQIIGLKIVATKSIIGAVVSAITSLLYRAKRFGTNSPNTKDIYAIARVIPTIDRISLLCGEMPIFSNSGITYLPSCSAPKAADKKPQNVIPT